MATLVYTAQEVLYEFKIEKENYIYFVEYNTLAPPRAIFPSTNQHEPKAVVYVSDPHQFLTEKQFLKQFETSVFEKRLGRPITI